jgi:hypothetical protein
MVSPWVEKKKKRDPGGLQEASFWESVDMGY